MINSESAAAKMFLSQLLKVLQSRDGNKGIALLPSYEEYLIMTNDTGTSRANYENNLVKQFKQFFEKYHHLLHKYYAVLTIERVTRFSFYKVSSTFAISADNQLQTIECVSISFAEQPRTADCFEGVGIQIEQALVVNGALRINHFQLVKVYESYRVDYAAINQKITSSEFVIKTYKELVETYPDLPLLPRLSKDTYIKLYPKSTIINGELSLEYLDISNNDYPEGYYEAIYVLGDLAVSESVINSKHEAGLALYVAGTLQTPLLMVGDNSVVIDGDLLVEEYINLLE